ncbi:MAG TPA: DUF6755 family protein [Capsulimonadaceae bacterium]|jgi:hypothetical protein
MRTSPDKARRSSMIVTIMILVMAVLLIQLWLVTLAVEGYMASRAALAWPTFGASLGCLLLNLRLLKYVYEIDRNKEQP